MGLACHSMGIRVAIAGMKNVHCRTSIIWFYLEIKSDNSLFRFAVTRRDSLRQRVLYFLFFFFLLSYETKVEIAREMSSAASVKVQAAITCTRVQTATASLAITLIVEKLLLDFTMSDNEAHDMRLDNENRSHERSFSPCNSTSS